jgi:hypothetical protein
MASFGKGADLMKITATMGHWSSVVGMGVHLLAPDGRMIGQVMFACHADELRGRDAQERLARICCDAINATALVEIEKGTPNDH